MTLKNNSINSGVSPKDAESLILRGADEILEQKLLEEIEVDKSSQKLLQDSKPLVVKNFQDVPEDLIFTKNCIFKLYNRESKRDFFIDGVALEAKIGIDEALYNKLKTRKVRAFCVENSVVCFEYAFLPKKSDI